MSSIQARLDELNPYVNGFSYGKTPLVQTSMPPKWVVYPSDAINVKALDQPTNGMTSYVFYSETATIDDMLDYIELIIQINKEREEKMKLLKTKVDELKALFTDNTLSTLQTLRFVIDSPIDVAEINNYDEVVADIESAIPTPEPIIVESEPQYVQVEEPVRYAKPVVESDGKPILEDFRPAKCKCVDGQVCPECVDY